VASATTSAAIAASFAWLTTSLTTPATRTAWWRPVVIVALAEGARGVGHGLADGGHRALADRDGLLGLRDEVLGGLLGADLLDQLLTAGASVVLPLRLAGRSSERSRTTAGTSWTCFWTVLG
jgi:hypothetical protein